MDSLKFYRVNEDKDTIGKVNNISPIWTVESIPIPSSVDILRPKISINFDNSAIRDLVNYCYIKDFKRYYFIESKDKVKGSNGLMCRLTLKVDVLESYKLDILNSRDVEFHNAVEVVQTVVNATKTPEREVSYLLTTVGG